MVLLDLQVRLLEIWLVSQYQVVVGVVVLQRLLLVWEEQGARVVAGVQVAAVAEQVKVVGELLVQELQDLLL
jgi:hypothetical protein